MFCARSLLGVVFTLKASDDEDDENGSDCEEMNGTTSIVCFFDVCAFVSELIEYYGGIYVSDSDWCEPSDHDWCQSCEIDWCQPCD
jgi:hypothetical protein